MKYRITDCRYTITPVNYEHGEDPNSEEQGDLYISGKEFNTIEELLPYVASNFGVNYSPVDDWFFSARGFGSLQTYILVNEYELKASREEIANWKAGEIELYNVHIFLTVKVFEEPRLFSEEDADLFGIEVM